MAYNVAMKPEDLLNHIPTKAEIARAFGCLPQSINDWFKAGEVPEVRQYQAQIITKGKLKADMPADRRKVV